MAYPEWVEKQKRPGTNITCSKGKYYLYEVSSVWDKEKKRARKITGKYLGRITEEGLLPPKRDTKKPKNITVKEYGASNTLKEVGNEIYTKLKEIYNDDASKIFSIAILRIIEKCPFKRVSFLYEKSFLSECFGKIGLSGASITNLLTSIGSDRQKTVQFMKNFIGDTKHILFDGTNIVTKSEKMNINRIGYNSHRQYDPQINLLYAFSSENKCPVYYRIIPGNIRDISSFGKTVVESGIKDMVVIADKGFGSNANFNLLDDNKLKYIVPLKRNNSLIEKEKLKTGDKNDFDGAFLFNGRVIWYYSYKKENKKIHIFLDRSLQTKEEKDYITRINENIEGYSFDGLMEKQYTFGTLALCTNLEDESEEIYKLYKSRAEIEQSFDFLKNLLELDKIYLQSEYAVEGWAFVNHISLMLCYRLYNALKNANLLSKYSVEDLLTHLKYIHKIKMDKDWDTTEISTKTQALLKNLNIHIT